MGKTFLAKTLAKQAFDCGVVPVLLSFAGPLKEEAIKKGYNKDEFPEKYREYCQDIGATMREGDPDYWVKEMHSSISKALKDERKHLEAGDKYWERCIIIDDCRYTNEIAYGMAKDAIRIFLSSGKRHLKDEDWRHHESEALANLIESGEGEEYRNLFQHILYNDKTEKDLARRIKPMVPVWCGIKIGCDDGTLLCGCENCKSRRDGNMLGPDSLFGELLDLLELEEWELDDEETEEGDT